MLRSTIDGYLRLSLEDVSIVSLQIIQKTRMTSARYFLRDKFFNALFFDRMCLFKRNATDLFLEGIYYIYMCIYIYIYIHRQIDRQIDRWIDRQIDKQMYISDVYIQGNSIRKPVILRIFCSSVHYRLNLQSIFFYILLYEK